VGFAVAQPLKQRELEVVRRLEELELAQVQQQEQQS
jgi:hypothetical protein